MITTNQLIEQLSKFPQGARVSIVDDCLVIIKPGECPLFAGSIHCPDKGRPRVTKLGGWKGWMDNMFHTAGGRIQRFLLERPDAARCIAFSAVSGLYLGEDDDTILPEDCSYPRGSGADYVDHVGEAVDHNDLMPLIRELQEAAEDA